MVIGLGVRPGDFTDAIVYQDPDAIDRVTFGFYVWPHFLRWLKRIKLLGETDPRDLIPVPPEPVSQTDLGAILLRPLYGDPDPQPSLVAARVRMLEEAISGLGELKELLTAELERVKSLSDGPR